MSERESYRSAYEHVPAKVIETISLNPSMNDGVTDPDLSRWLDSNHLYAHAAVFAFGGSTGELFLPQSPTMGRDVILESKQYYIDEFGNPYTMVTAKGSGMSSAVIGNIDQPNVYVYDREASIRRFNWGSPWGLFGYADAMNEMNTSNMIAEAGGRVGRVIANMVFHHTNLKEWYAEHEPESYIDIAHQLDVIEKRGEQAALCIRLQAAERIQDYQAAPMSGYYSPEQTLKRGIQFLRKEIRQKSPEKFAEQYHIDDIETKMQVLTQADHNLDDAALAVYGGLLYDLYFQTYIAKDQITEAKPELRITKQFHPHDFDLAGYIYDWELSLPKPSESPGNHKDDYQFSLPFISPDSSDEIRRHAIDKANTILGKKRFQPRGNDFHI
jgi:hypothetical protein